MIKEFIGICVGILLLATMVPAEASVYTTTDPNHPLTGTPSLAMQVPTVRYLNNRMPFEEPKTSQLNTLGHWEQQAKLLASDGSAEDYFTSLGISLSGDTAVIGAWGDDDLGVDAGSAYVFIRSGTTWTEQAKLLASDGGAGDAFGWCVEIQEDTLFIGAAGDTAMKGSVYVFTRTGTTWTEEAKILATDGAIGDQFGYCISLSGNSALIGANCDDDNGFDAGAAYVFKCTDDTWTQQAKLIASDGASMDSFGGEVSLSDETALIGSCFDDDNGFDSGSAYVFLRTGSTWTEQTKLLASDGASGDYFSAYAVSLSRDTAVIGAQGVDANGADSGSAYVFLRTGRSWTEQAKLLPTDGVTQDFFGGSVSLSNDTVLISAGGDDDQGGDAGAAYIFNRTNTTWTQEAKLLASDGSPGDVFGWTATLENDTALIGAYYDDENGIDSGSAYVFIKDENQPPTADFSWIPPHPPINQPITFDASTSKDPDGTIIRYEWDWNNDGLYEENQTTPTTTHTWGTLGNYPITLRVTDDDDNTNISTKTVNVIGVVNLTIDIKGGFGVTAVIKNTGNLNATDIHWTITLTGGYILFGATKSGSIISLSSGASSTIADKPIIGFGKTTIQVNVTCAEGPAATQITTGKIFLFFIFGVK